MTNNNIENLKLPDSKQPDFFHRLLKFGSFLENYCRKGDIYDLENWPNPVWQKIEERLQQGLIRLENTIVKDHQLYMLQWYNSGIILKTSNSIIAFDLVPVPRYYGWPDTKNLTEQLAEKIDYLFLTHQHQDHFDKELIQALGQKGKPIFAHPQIAAQNASLITSTANNQTFTFPDFSVISREGYHVWRENIEDVALVYFELTTSDNYSLIFAGDADYTKVFHSGGNNPEVAFITWRNPNCKFENDHPQQIGKTIDAIKILIDKINPERIILEHYGELDHVYKGFTPSFDLAIHLIKNSPAKTDIFFPGEVILIKS
ncbi:MAG: MBL fold metallo-hydrolase [Candidatus Rifleibacteriota bacterium]